MPYRDLEPAVAHIGRELQAHVRQRRSRRDRAEQRLLDLVVAEPAARARLFQLVDAFPALRGSGDVSDHIADYLDDEGVPRALRLAVRTSRRVPGGDRLSAGVARRGITHMASRFIAGTDAADARPAFERIWVAGMGVIVDLLGEKTITEPDADRYAARVAGLIDDLRATPGPGRRSIAIKPTALAPRLHPLTAEAGLAEARQRLEPILRAATAADLLVWFDMEQFEVKDLTLALFRSLLGDPALAAAASRDRHPGLPPRQHRDLADLLAWSAERRRPISVRLVKGAYWDAETCWLGRTAGPSRCSSTRATPTPASSAAPGSCSSTMPAGPDVQPAFASHNVRSIAHAIAVAESSGLPTTGIEIQMLYGMARAEHGPFAPGLRSASTRPSARCSRAWPTWSAACWRTRPTIPSSAWPLRRGRRARQLLGAAAVDEVGYRSLAEAGGRPRTRTAPSRLTPEPLRRVAPTRPATALPPRRE